MCLAFRAGAEAEARVLLRYVSSGSGVSSEATREECDRFLTALDSRGIPAFPLLSPFILRYPVVLGPVDFATRLLEPDCALQKKLRVAAAIVECSPNSADWLLVPKQSKPQLAFELARLFARITLKAIIAAPLIAVGWLRGRNARR